MHPRPKGFVAARKLPGRLTKDTVEQITVAENAPINNADDGSESETRNPTSPSVLPF